MIRLGLTGYPLEHSLSPRLHAAALRAAGLEGEYRLYPVRPEDHAGLARLLERLRAGKLNGLNVTIPHKQNVIPLLDELAPAAAAIGAVNTIFLKDGRLVGENTDAPGFLADLNRLAGTFSGSSRQALVLGAGGAARAVIHALRSAGWDVIVAARRIEQAQALAVSGGAIHSISLDVNEMRQVLNGINLIVNTTPVGMFPHAECSPWPEGLAFPSAQALYDLVYNPRETRLIQQARSAGLRAAGGSGMLVEQAALSFEIWTQRAAPLESMFSALEE